jgi:hypothetical protein
MDIGGVFDYSPSTSSPLTLWLVPLSLDSWYSLGWFCIEKLRKIKIFKKCGE